MYILREISRTETTILAEMIPMKERRYVNSNGILVIEYYMNDDLKLPGQKMAEGICICKYLLEKGDILYRPTEYSDGIAFDIIKNIKYCPCCGRELPEEDDDE